MSVPGRKAGKLGAPKNVESDEFMDLYCQPCSDEGQQFPAAGFCVDCCEYLCKKCFEHHCTPRQMKYHVLQDETTMPRSKPKTRILDATVDKCLQHQGEAITFNCRSHDQLVCGICVVIDHRSCDGVSYVENEYNDLKNNLTAIEQQVDNNIKTTEQNVADINAYCSDAVESIGQFKEEINHFLDKLEQDVINEAKRVRNEDQANVTSVTAKLDNMKSEIHSTTSNLNHLHNTKKNGILFPTMDKIKLEMQTLEQCLTKLQTDNKIQRYRFEPEKQIQELMRNLIALGNLSLTKEPNDNTTIQLVEPKESKTTQPLEQPNDNKATQTEIANDSKATQTQIPNYSKMIQKYKVMPEPRTATHKTDINLLSANEWHNSCITGSVLLPGNQLLIVDHTYSKIKLVDTKQTKIMTEIHMPQNPWDITKVNDTQVAVTIPNKKQIQFLSVVSQSLTKTREIKVNGRCWGIVHNDGTLIVTFQNPAKVDIVNMNGKVLKSVMNDAINKQLFVNPFYIAISPDTIGIYVSDYIRNTVTCLAVDGTVKGVYKDVNLKNPRGLAVEKSGSVYVCGEGSHNIHQITDECIKIKILLGPEHRLSKPFSITYCDREDELYVGTESSRVVEVYHLK